MLKGWIIKTPKGEFDSYSFQSCRNEAIRKGVMLYGLNRDYTENDRRVVWDMMSKGGFSCVKARIVEGWKEEG